MVGLPNSQNVALAENYVLFTVYFYLRSAVLGEDHFVTDFYIHRSSLAAVQEPSRTDCHDFTLLGTLFGSIRQYDSALCAFFFGTGFNHYSILSWLNHLLYPLLGGNLALTKGEC